MVGRNFLAIVSFDIVDLVMEYSKSLSLTNTKNQWFYIISDTNMKKKDIHRFQKLLREGDNVAFLYNSTQISDLCTVLNSN